MASPNERALQSDIPPNSKSDNQWLRDMGYRGGLHEFKIIYGFKLDEYVDAQSLIEQIRDEQQKEWELAAPSRAKAKQVGEAMLWHQRLGHIQYVSLLRIPSMTTGMPSFEGLTVGDLPNCATCTECGMDVLRPLD